MTIGCLEQALSDLNMRVSKLSKQVKIYGAIVTLGAVIIPAYSQITTAFAETRIEQSIRRQLTPVISSVIKQAITEAKADKSYCE